MIVRKLQIVDVVNNRCLAYFYPGENTWHDPFGGQFSSDEQRSLFRVAEDGLNTVVLNYGTKNERNVLVRFVAEFE